MINILDKYILLPEDNTNQVHISNLTEKQVSMYVDYYFRKRNNNLLIVTDSIGEANKLYDQLLYYNNNVYLFPMDDFIISISLAKSPDLKQVRIDTLIKTLNNDKKIIITNLNGYLTHLSSKQEFANSILSLKKGDNISKEELIKKLVNIGYVREDVVSNVGTIATRGFIVDVYPLKSDNPVRIEFWDDEIDSIREFHVDSQLSIKTLSEIILYPCDEFEKFNSEPFNILEYLDNPIVFYNNYEKIVNEYQQLKIQINEYNTNMNKNEKYMFSLNDIHPPKEIFINLFDSITNSNCEIKNILKKIDISPLNILQQFEFIRKLIKTKKTVIICCNEKKQIKKLYNEFENECIITTINEIINNNVNIIEYSLLESFCVDNYYFISIKDILKDKELEKNSPLNSNYRKNYNLSSFKKGDYVVHKYYGIGIYQGINTITKNKIKKDYLQIDYKNNDKLYIPVENINLISKYSSKEGTKPNLSKLGTTDWEKTKHSVRKKICDISERLMKLSAEREKNQGYAFAVDDDLQYQFEKEFEYELTSGQNKAIYEIKKDMEKSIPMDRLLCGDVGFGKTEVAFRAIFKAIVNNKQVTYLCPTTILSKQQYESALKRFKNFSINIRLLNRFTSKREENSIYQDLELGKIDLLIGTHKLLNKKIKYYDLGLLVIDEEQRFGVLHKEAVKEYKNTIDVLTLSATPIPRTLQMSLTGIKKISLIETAPVNRYPVQTYVLEENNQIIKEAIKKELSRKGQCFILYNNVEKIIDKVVFLKQLVPEARICYSHGQMNKVDIENTMEDFINYKYDVLVCTTIIESGIDIPNVNTLIVYSAENFGLSQLYQIRGRVGRSNKIAFAYLMYNKSKVLTDLATKRLMAIKEFTELGSGFSIAMRDLSIRGAGDVLGSEQAGFIDSVGYSLYLEMLQEEINKIKGIPIKSDKETKILLDVDTHIDDDYVDSESLKIEIHKKIDMITSLDIMNSTINELKDRFGKLPQELVIYMYEKFLENILTDLSHIRMEKVDKNIQFIINEYAVNNLDAKELFFYVNEVDSKAKFNYKNKRIIVLISFDNDIESMKKIINIILYIKEAISIK